MKISVIIPVLHERSLINSTIDQLERMPSNEKAEIIVIDGSKEADTIKKITNNRVKTYMCEKGRARQMNKGAVESTGDILLFLHSDTGLPDNAFEKIAHVMSEERYAAGAFDLSISDGNVIFRIIERTASLRSRFTRIPYGDQAIFFRRDRFFELRGYKDIPLMEDVDLMMRAKKKQWSVCFLDEKVTTSSRRWRKEGIFTCTIRNWIIISLYLLGVSPKNLAKLYS